MNEASGKTVKSANFDRSYLINGRNRKRYGVNYPFKVEKNLFYYPDENNRKVIRKLDPLSLPTNVMIYWKDNNNPDGMGSALLTDLFTNGD
ncbi:hypothetical protein ACTHO0_22710 [Cytobacillus praedii]|uniref:hypothetical protein n=1 Tax=Cytobacillus praedii TaxID=1742358 RepID=UPI003F81642A